MSEWIEVNLPFSYPNNYFNFPEKPNLYEKAIPVIGINLFNELNRFIKENLECPAMLLYDIKEKLKIDIRKDFIKNNISLNKIEDKLTDIINNTTDNKLKWTLFLIQKQKEYDEWLNKQPEIIEWKKRYEEEKTKNKITFMSLELNKPGTLMEVESFGQKDFILIGHVGSTGLYFSNNKMCDLFVLKYKIVWECPKI